MKKVESLSEFQSYVRNFRKTYGRGASNCFFVPSEIQNLTDKGSLYVEEAQGMLCFPVKEADCFRLFYYLSDHAEIHLPEISSPVLCDLTFRGEESAAIEKMGGKRLLQSGFSRYKMYCRMEIFADDYQKGVSENLPARAVKKLSPANFEAVKKLWFHGLDEYSTPLPEESEFAAIAAEGGILGISDGSGELAGVCQLSFHGKTVIFEHLTVKQECRGKGYGSALFLAALSEVFESRRNERMNLWVDEKNLNARLIYKKYGMKPDGLRSVQYIIEGRKQEKQR